MDSTQALLLVSGLIALMSSVANAVYWAVHKNGKGNLRLLTAAIMLYFGVATLYVGFGVPTNFTGHQLIRQWTPILYIIPVWDLIIDWKQKKSKSV